MLGGTFNPKLSKVSFLCSFPIGGVPWKKKGLNHVKLTRMRKPHKLDSMELKVFEEFGRSAVAARGCLVAFDIDVIAAKHIFAAHYTMTMATTAWMDMLHWCVGFLLHVCRLQKRWCGCARAATASCRFQGVVPRVDCEKIIINNNKYIHKYIHK